MPAKRLRLKKVKRNAIPELQPKELEVLARYDEIVKKTRGFDSDLAESLDALTNMPSYLRNVPVPSLSQYAAAELTSETEACEATGVKFARTSEHPPMLKDAPSLPVSQLSPPMSKFPLLTGWTGINSDLRSYYQSTSHIQILWCTRYKGISLAYHRIDYPWDRDRLEHLEDRGALKLVKFWLEVAMQFRGENAIFLKVTENINKSEEFGTMEETLSF
jgi:hypothetical protein